MIVSLAVLGVAIATVFPVFAVLRILSMPLHRPTWYVWFETVNGVALITVLALPVAALAVWALARRRSAAGVPSAWRMSLAEVGIVYGTVPWVWMIMLAGGQVESREPGAAAGPAHDVDGPDRRQPAAVRGAGVLRPAAVRGAGLGAAGPGARGGLLGRWSRPRSTSCRWTGCPQWTTYCSTPPAPGWPHWRRAPGGAPGRGRRQGRPDRLRCREVEPVITEAHHSTRPGLYPMIRQVAAR